MLVAGLILATVTVGLVCLFQHVVIRAGREARKALVETVFRQHDRIDELTARLPAARPRNNRQSGISG